MIVFIIRIIKTKLTVTVDEELLPRAKQVARQRGVSLSNVIEESLKRLTATGGDFVGKWRGGFRARKSAADPRAEFLKRKYLANSD